MAVNDAQKTEEGGSDSDGSWEDVDEDSDCDSDTETAAHRKVIAANV